MKLFLDKLSGVFKTTFVIGLMLMFLVTKVNAQGQSIDKNNVKKIESMYEKYSFQLKVKSQSEKQDSIKNVTEIKDENQLRKVKRTSSSMFVSQQTNKCINTRNSNAGCRIPLIKEIDFTLYAANFDQNR